MTGMEALYVFGYDCDKPGCPATVTGEELPYCQGLDTYWAEAKALGWTKWAGRSQHTYCPDHGPSKGHTMRFISGGAS
jgi:hypothetical protein